MALGEFELIDCFLRDLGHRRDDVILGIGDDGAVLRMPPGQDLVVSMDVLVAGRHFADDHDPEAVGYKSLAVNLSDLAAMGAEPAWVTLGLTIPEANESWLTAFCRGFGALARQHRVALVGGDTTRGPLTISVQVHGLVPEGLALTRRGAGAGDLICVTGTLGDAALGLALARGEPRPAGLDAVGGDFLQGRLQRPTPRVAEGMALRGMATAAIDVSDGLAQDLGHVLNASGVGARLESARLPLSLAGGCFARDLRMRCALAGGDDYELLFTLPPQHRAGLHERAQAWACGYTVIGEIRAEPGLACVEPDGGTLTLERTGHDHFR